MTQQGDVRLFQTQDDGDIEVENGVVSMDGGIETAAYLSLFGGQGWWGNIDEPLIARQYNATTGALIDGLPATSNNLRRIEAAALEDLNWFLTERVANSVEVVASLIGPKKIKLNVAIEANGNINVFEYVENWQASVPNVLFDFPIVPPIPIPPPTEGYDPYMEGLSPTAYYRMDGNGDDQTGNGNNFTVNGTPSTSPSLYGGTGTSLTFVDTDSMVIDRGGFPPMIDGRTIAMWVQTTDTRDYVPMYSQDSGEFGFVMLTPSINTSNGFSVVKRVGNNFTYALGYYTITDDTPHFITVTEDETYTYVYVDGTFTSRTAGGFLSEYNTGSTNLGTSAYKSNFQGTLDGVLIDNRLLTHAELTGAYREGRPPTDAIGYDMYVVDWLSIGTASFYKLDDTTGEDSLSGGRDMIAGGVLATVVEPLCVGSTGALQFDGVAYMWRTGLFTYSNARTVGFWIQVQPGDGTDKTIYSQYTAEFNGTKIIASDSTLNGNLSLQLNGQSRYDSGFAIDDGLPHFVVIVDITSSLAKGTQFYLDGVPYNRTYDAFGLLSYGTSYFSLAAKRSGSSSSNVSEQLPCVLDGFFVTSNSPTYEQVVQLYENGVLPIT